MNSLPVPEPPEIAQCLAAAGVSSAEGLEKLIQGMTDDEAVAMLSDWDLWQLPYQAMPEGKWRCWIFRAGRGSGKTHTGARTVSNIARDPLKIKGGEIGIIGRTHTDARSTMVEGPGGILEQAPYDFRPVWSPGNHTLVWPNGTVGRIFSADKPESLRGANWSFVWADEPDYWENGTKTWTEVVELALRLGWARALLTSTPGSGQGLLHTLEKKTSTVTTRAGTMQNYFLPQSVRQELFNNYQGTRIGRQELDGDYIDALQGAMFSQDAIDAYRVKELPELVRVCVGVDPAVSTNPDSDETGIVCGGVDTEGVGYVIRDKSDKYSPLQWARAVVASYVRHGADLIIGEVNNGGDLVEANVRSIEPNVNFLQVHATRGKQVRAEPIAALVRRGRIRFCGQFPELEEQLTEWIPSAKASKSPDRLDAFVWCFWALMLQKKVTGDLGAYGNVRH